MNTPPEGMPKLQRPIIIMGCTSIVGIVMIINGYRVHVDSAQDQIYSSFYILGGLLFLAINFMMEAVFSAANFIVESLRAELGPMLAELHRGVKTIENMPAPAATGAPVRIRVDKSDSPETASAQPKTPYYYSTDGTVQGPLTAADLRSFREDGLITDNTPVRREGESQWSTFRDYAELKA